MSVYVDPLMDHGWRLSGKQVPNCHLFTDGPDEELHALAVAIGMKRRWAQRGGIRKTLHYDLTAKWRALAVVAGAIEVTCNEAVAIWRGDRQNSSSVCQSDGGIEVSPPRRYQSVGSAVTLPELEPGECNQGQQSAGPCDSGKLSNCYGLNGQGEVPEQEADASGKREAYIELLKKKIPQAEVAGFEPVTAPHESLFPHQVDIARWMVRGGRRACFADFGLGKTRIHLQVAKWVIEHTAFNGKFLIVAPLGVRQEFTLSDGPAMGIPVKYVRTNAEVDEAYSAGFRIMITNFERVRDGDIDVSRFDGAGLDEASVLRSFGTKTYQEFLKLFRTVLYLFVFTATPSPNRHKELIHYGGFLRIMDTGEALTRFFQRDSSQANNLTLYPHMERQFWLWLSSWAVFVQRPSDLGYSDEGYDLPEMHVHWHKVDVDNTAAWEQTDSCGQSQLFLDQAQGLAQSAASKRDSIALRVSQAIDLMAEAPDRHWLLWHDLEDERREIERRIPEAVTVYGSQDLDLREERIMAFSHGEISVLATKPVIAGSGCNFQRHCSDAIFLGVGYKFNDFIQAIHRIYRFQQTKEVRIHIIYLDSESSIMEVLKEKWRRHDELMAKMSELLQQYKLSNQTTMELIRTLGCEREEVKGERFRVIHNDCVLEAQTMESNSVDFICTSIPFGNQYEYSPSFNDFGHNTGDAKFFEQMGFLVPEALRVLKPGRIAAVHVKDRIMFGNLTGYACPTVNPFSDKTAMAFMKAGFLLMARITIDTDVVRENAQTYRLGWSENAKDSSKMGAGMPEYVLVFRKLPTDLSNAYADEPVTKDKAEYTRADWQLDAAGLWRSNGNRLPDPEIMRNMPMEDIKRMWINFSLSGGYSHEEHVRIAKALEELGKLPSSFMLFPAVSRHADIWTDINRMVTLNNSQAAKGKEKHVCPLQLDIIRRLIKRYTNRGDLVWDPFAGIGSVLYEALRMGRRAIGTELNLEYWQDSVGYCELAEAEMAVPTLFDMAKLGNGEATAAA